MINLLTSFYLHDSINKPIFPLLFLRKNFLEVDIFYKSLSYVVETHKPAYSVNALISKYEREREREREREKKRESL